MKIVGITGGIGSGKSLVGSMLKSLGYQIYVADIEAKKLMVSNTALIEQIKQLFGEKAYFKNGELNRKYIASIVFKDHQKLKQLNEIVHPATKKDFVRWIDQLSDYNKPLAFKEAAIMYESGSDQETDDILLIYAPKTLRISRTMKRDEVDQEAVLSRMDKQWPALPKLQRSSFVIYNDGTHQLIPQLIDAIRFFS